MHLLASECPSSSDSAYRYTLCFGEVLSLNNHPNALWEPASCIRRRSIREQQRVKWGSHFLQADRSPICAIYGNLQFGFPKYTELKLSNKAAAHKKRLATGCSLCAQMESLSPKRYSRISKRFCNLSAIAPIHWNHSAKIGSISFACEP
jgi:hypothetical protein